MHLELLVTAKIGNREIPDYVVYDSTFLNCFEPLAKQADCYDLIWHPEENGIKIADQLAEVLPIYIERVMRMKTCMSLDCSPSNGCNEVLFKNHLTNLLEKCESYPESKVHVSHE